MTFFLEASATDNDGSVTNVEFFDDLQSLGSAVTRPFRIGATINYGGTHQLTALARDNAGWISTSAVVTVTIQGGRLWNVDVTDRQFVPPQVDITAGDTVRWTVRGSLNHTVTSGDGRFPAGTLTNGEGSMYQFTFTNAGTYPYLCAYHTSDTISSQRGTVMVQPMAAPLVSIVQPTNNSIFTTRDLITFTATATDPNGSIVQVEFLDFGQPFGDVVTEQPYSITLGLAPGPHQITARATDSENGITVSSPIHLQVNTIALTNPILERIPKGDLTIELRPVAESLASPLGMAVPDDGSGRMFVYDQAGLIWVLTSAGLSAEPLLDVRTNLVALGNYDERGLLGLVTHPQFAQNPRIYTFTSQSNAGPADFTSDATNHNHQSVISEWQIDVHNPNRVDPSTRREILRIDKPQSNHNGGTMRFGPDNYLYIALGDGGRADDQGDGHLPEGNAQSLWRIYGKLLRIDIDGSDSLNGQYGVPQDNPLLDYTDLGEIFAYGLRNPFSFSFDRETGDLYLGDVGQNKIEEINLIVGGGNYGWRVKEGTFFFDPNGANAGYVTDTPVVPVVPEVVEPIAQYDHDDGLAVIGGYVYRGTELSDLQGRYVFGDWGSFTAPSGRLFYLDTNHEIKEFRLGLDDRALGYWVKGFGEDTDGELYVMASQSLGPRGTTGKVFKIVAPPDPVRITAVTANQANTTIAFTWNASPGGRYQVQFNNSLSQIGWTDRGQPLTATNSVMSTSDAIGPDPVRLYRVVPLP